MSQQSPAWFGHQLHQHQTEAGPAQSSHLSHVLQHSMLLPKPPTTSSRVRLSGPGLPSHQWFSSYQTGSQTVPSADKLQHSQPAHTLPSSSMTKETVQAGLPSPRSIPNAVQHAASHAVSPATVKPVSHIMSHDTLPGPAPSHPPSLPKSGRHASSINNRLLQISVRQPFKGKNPCALVCAAAVNIVLRFPYSSWLQMVLGQQLAAMHKLKLLAYM
jgi:hypothetical protein